MGVEHIVVITGFLMIGAIGLITDWRVHKKQLLINELRLYLKKVVLENKDIVENQNKLVDKYNDLVVKSNRLKSHNRNLLELLEILYGEDLEEIYNTYIEEKEKMKNEQQQR